MLLTTRCQSAFEQFNAVMLHDDAVGWSMYGTPTLFAQEYISGTRRRISMVALKLRETLV